MWSRMSCHNDRNDMRIAWAHFARGGHSFLQQTLIFVYADLEVSNDLYSTARYPYALSLNTPLYGKASLDIISSICTIKLLHPWYIASPCLQGVMYIFPTWPTLWDSSSSLLEEPSFANVAFTWKQSATSTDLYLQGIQSVTVQYEHAREHGPNWDYRHQCKHAW